jgi:hypothetical protein
MIDFAPYVIPTVQGLLALALFLVAALCLKLERKLDRLRDGSDGVAQAAGRLAAEVAKAEAAVASLREASGHAGADLQKRIEEARETLETLKLLSTTARAVHGGPTLPAPRPAEAAAPSAAPPRADAFETRRAERLALRRDPPGGERWGGLR